MIDAALVDAGHWEVPVEYYLGLYGKRPTTLRVKVILGPAANEIETVDCPTGGFEPGIELVRLGPIPFGVEQIQIVQGVIQSQLFGVMRHLLIEKAGFAVKVGGLELALVIKDIQVLITEFEFDPLQHAGQRFAVEVVKAHQRELA